MHWCVWGVRSSFTLQTLTTRITPTDIPQSISIIASLSPGIRCVSRTRAVEQVVLFEHVASVFGNLIIPQWLGLHFHIVLFLAIVVIVIIVAIVVIVVIIVHMPLMIVVIVVAFVKAAHVGKVVDANLLALANGTRRSHYPRSNHYPRGIGSTL